MDKKFKTLTLSFENCESLEIPADAIKYVSLEDITQNIYGEDNQIEVMYTAKNTILQLDDGVLKKIKPTFSDLADVSGLKRLVSFNDIVSLIFTTEDDHQTEVYVDWEDDEITGGQSNIYQHYKVIPHKEGKDSGLSDIVDGLFIVIGKDARFPVYVREDEEDE